MKIEITKEKGLKFSTNGIKVVILEENQILEVEDGGFTKANLNRLVELGVARVLEVADLAKPATEEPKKVDLKKTRETQKSKKMIADLKYPIDNKGE